MDQDTELTKAALLYADHVELVSLGASLFHELNDVVEDGDLGGYGLLTSLDDETIAYIASRSGTSGNLAPGWRENLAAVMALDPDAYEASGLEGAEDLREIYAAAAAHSRDMRERMANLLEEQGATELVTAIRSGAVEIADLGTPPTSTLRPTDLPATESSQTTNELMRWTDALIDRLTDKCTRLLFDRGAGNMIQSMLEAGLIPANPPGLRLAAQAALGAGFAERLPAFPTAKMDELLDLRKELALPLARYRGAVSKFSRDMPQVVGDDLNFEVEQLWQEVVAPTLLGLKDEMADHGLVRELARSLDVNNVRDFAQWTAGTYVTVAATSSLDALASGLVATASGGAATVVLEAVRARRDGSSGSRSNEFYYLYEANRRLM